MVASHSAAMIWPLIAQTALTAIVWVRLYVVRLGEVRNRRLNPQALATSREAARELGDERAADNLRNLFEFPLLFYAVCLLFVITGLGSAVHAALAWLYVGLRAGHSLIHLTYNRVVHRFAVHVASTLCLLGLWLWFAVDLAAGSGR